MEFTLLILVVGKSNSINKLLAVQITRFSKELLLDLPMRSVACPWRASGENSGKIISWAVECAEKKTLDLPLTGIPTCLNIDESAPAPGQRKFTKLAAARPLAPPADASSLGGCHEIARY